jgi:hypothetical protein
MKDSYDFSEAKRGPVAPSKGKSRITIMLDDKVLNAARERADAEGIGYQTLINSLLRKALLNDKEEKLEVSINELHSMTDLLLAVAKQQELLTKNFESSFASFEGVLAKAVRNRTSRPLAVTVAARRGAKKLEATQVKVIKVGEKSPKAAKEVRS